MCIAISERNYGNENGMHLVVSVDFQVLTRPKCVQVSNSRLGVAKEDGLKDRFRTRGQRKEQRTMEETYVPY